jgi:hypothetical protein
MENSYMNLEKSLSDDRTSVGELPIIQANVKSITIENGDEMLDIYVYKNQVL